LLKIHKKMTKRYNSKRAPAPFRLGELVYYRNHPVSDAKRKMMAKFAPRWKGPFRGGKVLTPVTVSPESPTKGEFITRAHVSALKPGPHRI
jgi:hypothetical protein